MMMMVLVLEFEKRDEECAKGGRARIKKRGR
jgi:hypothetical protein